jgi:hypothetical protein
MTECVNGIEERFLCVSAPLREKNKTERISNQAMLRTAESAADGCGNGVQPDRTREGRQDGGATSVAPASI